MTSIVVTHEDNKTNKFEFEPGQTVITLGRRSSNDVCIPDLSVSGNHATLTLLSDKATLEDLGSTNGSYVNGEVIKLATVKSSDDIILGKVQVNLTLKEAPAQHSAVVSEQSADDIDALSYAEPANDAGRNDSDRNADREPDRETALGAVREKSRDTASTITQAQPSRNTPAPEHGLASNTDRADSDVATIVRPRPVDNNSHSAREETASGRQQATASAQQAQEHPLEGLEHKVIPSVNSAVTPMHELDSASSTSKGAVIEIKNGAKSGQILPIDKPVTTLGRPGIQIAAIMRKPDGYFLMHIESDDNIDRPTLNSDTVGDEPMLLHSGDALTVAGIDVEFMLS